MSDIPNTEEFERCVMCGAVTCVPISMPVDWRENYEIGFGQICSKCADTLQDETWSRNTLSYREIMMAVEQSRTENDQQ